MERMLIMMKVAENVTVMSLISSVTWMVVIAVMAAMAAIVIGMGVTSSPVTAFRKSTSGCTSQKQ